MPIYEFYCPDCHAIFSFMVRAQAENPSPGCPSCSRTSIEKRPSTFAIRSTPDGSEESPVASDTQLEQAMASLAQSMDRASESEDPRQLSQLFRQFGKDSGLEVGPQLDEALGRMERGDDLESIEKDLDATDDSLSELFKLRRIVKASKAPRIDETLHFLD